MVFGTYNMSLSETGPASMKELATSRYIQGENKSYVRSTN